MNSTSADQENVDSVEKSILLFKNQQLNDVATLHQGFNLHRMPQNYLTKRSNIEKIIYHATMSDALKSPFSAFTVASRFLKHLDSIDVISGVRTFKALAKLLLDTNQRTSVMIHRIGGTWLLDEFNIDSFLLSAEHSRKWSWLRKFLREKNFSLCESEFARDALILRDLYIKFLYHTVNDLPDLGLRTIQNYALTNPPLQKCLPAPDACSISAESHSLSEARKLSRSPCREFSDTADDSFQFNPNAHIGSSPKRTWFSNSDEYLHIAKWKLQDLSFLVGSDLAIFGTPKHPCISLKLSPIHETINVLTGMDIWLENILNEVPEVAMCYHHEGIVMQEYEIYKTCDLPAIAGFEAKHVYGFVRNLVMFLKRNATQEGHTYWLVKEPGLGIVKLYDLTALCANDVEANQNDDDKDEISGENPFILPVATLCYRLAERRWSEYRMQTSNVLPVNEEAGILLDESTALLDALRLVKNCLNLIHMAEMAMDTRDGGGNGTSIGYVSNGLTDLKTRAIVLLCQVYLASPFNSMKTCARLLLAPPPKNPEVTTLDLNDLSPDINDDPQVSGGGIPNETGDNSAAVTAAHRRDNRLLGNTLLEALKSSDTNRISQLAIRVLESCTPLIHSEPSMYASSSGMLSTTGLCARAKNEDSLRTLLPVTLLKLYLNKAEELWIRAYQHSCVKSETSSTWITILKAVFRFTLLPVLILEHYVPDDHTTMFNNLPSDASTAVCPHCGCVDQEGGSAVFSVDVTWLAEKLQLASCLFAGSVIGYMDELKKLGAEKAVPTLEEIHLEASDVFLLRTLCVQAQERVHSWLNAIVFSPIDDILSETSVDHKIQRPEWLEVLNLIARCLRRVFTTGRPPKPKGAKRSAGRSRHSKERTRSSASTSIMVETPSSPTKGTITAQLRVSSDLWPALLSRYLVALRLKFCIDVTVPEFSQNLHRCIYLLHHDPVCIEDLSPHVQILHMTNLFQAYKLAAAAAASEVTDWSIGVLESLPSSLSPAVLPLKALIWCDTRKASASSRTRNQFSLVGVCLARGLEALIHLFAKHKANGNEQLFHHFHMSLVGTCLEFTSFCANTSDLPKITDAEYLKTILTVVRQVTKRLPEELIGDPSRKSANYDRANAPLNRSEILRLLNLRAYMVDIMLRWVQCPGVKDSGESFIEILTSVIVQYRAAISWHLAHLVLPVMGPTEESVASDMVDLLNFVSRLVRLESFNASILSISKLVQVLKDFLLCQPVIDIFALRLGSDQGLDSQVDNLKAPAEHILILLLFVCKSILDKHVAETMGKRNRKKEKRIMAEKQYPEVDLALTLIHESDFPLDCTVSDIDRSAADLKIRGANSVQQVCRLLSDKLKILSSHFCQSK